ncbi:uncharacterized protein LOC113508883 [Trichoplusia ni]|uniref:Uncharacterized protein LOC113508883 n=1 Tax=Trichoplusia ni TaxID=7111 RepID=A0A7E5X3R6_TRINI|nr:uncharacterized protein LOC113508883 [Trichoplusia ni]
MSSVDLYTMGQKLQEQSSIYNRRITRPETRRHLKIFNTYHRLLKNEKFVDGLKRELKHDDYDFRNGTCSLNDALKYDVKYYVKLKGSKCFRRLSKRPDVIEKFTRFLNKFADPKYPFDEEMSSVILQKLEGNLNLRYGEVDFKRIIAYLRKALRYHGSKTNTQIIQLQSKNCVTIYLSGCFCRHGFVENQGLCVRPEDCIGNSAHIDYLQRIVIH